MDIHWKRMEKRLHTCGLISFWAPITFVEWIKTVETFFKISSFGFHTRKSHNLQLYSQGRVQSGCEEFLLNFNRQLTRCPLLPSGLTQPAMQ